MERNQNLGIVVIGRNEGERLRRCLISLQRQADAIVYVDSGSSDGSVAVVEAHGVEVLCLDQTTPFSAARARNEGLAHLCRTNPALGYVQFIDGDCELNGGWLAPAVQFLEQNPDYAVVCGRLRERAPDSTLYNLLCDIEWDTPVGDINACGGVFLARRSALELVGGFDPTVVAGEEPELCFRLRQQGLRIHRLDIDMATHDAAMHTFFQWFRRAKRAGHAYAQGYFLHRAQRHGYNAKQSVKVWLWALLFPLLVVLLSTLIDIRFLLLFMVYVLRFARIAVRKYLEVDNLRRSLVYAWFTLLAPWPQLVGQLVYVRRLMLRRDVSILEHR